MKCQATGITDAERPDQNFFGVERALDFIRAYRRESAKDIVNGLYGAVREFSDGMPQVDDITTVVCKVLDPREGTRAGDPAGGPGRRGKHA